MFAHRLRRWLSAFGAVALIGLHPAPAGALPGPRIFSTGFVDEANFQNPSLSVRTLWFSRARGLGSTLVRLGAYWNQIAPARPSNPADPDDAGYDFATLDAGVRSATAARQAVLILLVGPPTWALGPGAPPGTYPGTWRPSPSALAAFARAVALRYSGHFPDPLAPGRTLPRVSRFQVWNEPNLRTYLSPQWLRARNGSWVPASPAIYRTMLNAAFRAITAVQRHAVVMAAGTAPYGDPPGVDRMAPVVFMRELLCLHGAALRRERCSDPAHFDAVDHHPYTLTPAHHASSPTDVSLPDLGRLQRILRVAQRRHTVLPAGPKPMWVTEIDWDSNPPDLSSPISLSKQAHYLSVAFYELWRQGVSHVMWFIMRDISYKSLAGSGVYFASGAPKPSAAAFRFPFVALRGRGGTLTIWGRAPRRGTVAIERATRHGWRTLLRLRSTPGGVFYSVSHLGRRATLRALVRAVASPPYPTG